MIPKFRAWYKKNTLPMLSVSLISFDQNFIDVYIDKEFQSETEMSFDFDEVILMRSTGLFDKNGQEIFEGDVVKRISLSPGGVDCVGIVKMLEGAWVIDTGNAAVSLWTEIDENEVLGNVYENPDLVEVNND